MVLAWSQLGRDISNSPWIPGKARTSVSEELARNLEPALRADSYKFNSAGGSPHTTSLSVPLVPLGICPLHRRSRNGPRVHALVIVPLHMRACLSAMLHSFSFWRRSTPPTPQQGDSTPSKYSDFVFRP